MAHSRLEIEEQQKKEWLDEHLPYELMMARYSIAQLRQATFWLTGCLSLIVRCVGMQSCRFPDKRREAGNNFRP